MKYVVHWPDSVRDDLAELNLDPRVHADFLKVATERICDLNNWADNEVFSFTIYEAAFDYFAAVSWRTNCTGDTTDKVVVYAHVSEVVRF